MFSSEGALKIGRYSIWAWPFKFMPVLLEVDLNAKTSPSFVMGIMA